MALLLFLVVAVRLFACPAPAGAQVAPAGAVVSSASTATYRLGEGELTARSNEIAFHVLPVFGPLLFPDGTAAAPAATGRAFAGETVFFSFTLANAGNAADRFDLAVDCASPSAFVPAATVVYLDADRDSVLDPGETAVTSIGPLGIGEEAAILLAATLPAGLTGDERCHLDLRARSRGDTSLVDAGNVVRIEARREARVPILLAADVDAVLPGEEIRYTIAFENAGERAAADVVVADFIDYGGMGLGTAIVPGSVSATLPGVVEYLDAADLEWTDVSPAAGEVRGVRLRLESLSPGGAGELAFSVRVRENRERGEVLNAATIDFTGGDARLYTLSSNETAVLVGPVSAIFVGPAGDPAAEGDADRVVVSMTGADSLYTFRHEILNDGNFADTLVVALADSALVPAGWEVVFVDSAGLPLPALSAFTARAGVVPRGETSVVGLQLAASPEAFRRFAGRELAFDVEARSIVPDGSRDRVRDVLVKTGLPTVSIVQSIREPTAMAGDIVSFIVLVENLTDETAVDSVIVVENLSPALGWAGGSDEPERRGNVLRFRVGRLEPGEKREIVFRAIVTAGQERDHIVSNAWAYGVTELGERIADGPAAASVRVVEGIFTRRGTILGCVFLDADADGRRGGEERGLAGAAVFIEDGTRAVTDSAGLYSIPGVLEGTHVVRLDPSSIPDSLAAASAGYFGLGEEGELILTLAPSGSRRADFPVVDPSTERGEAAFAAIEGNAQAAAGGGGRDAPVADSTSVAGRRTTGAPPGGTGPEWTETTGFEALTISSAQFAPGSADLEDIPLREIAALGLWLREHDGWSVLVEGHTDSIPISTAEFPSNFVLSVGRARAVAQILLMNGIPEDRVDFTGHGPRRPVAPNDTPEGRASNRRVEITAVPPSGYAGEDPGLPAILAAPDTTTFSLADDSGVCEEIVRPDEGRLFHTRDAIDVELSAPLTAEVDLYVNNVPVGREKIGQKRIDVGTRTLGLVYHDVKIAPGRNDILVVVRRPGAEQTTCVRRVWLAGRPAGIVPERERIAVPADGKTAPELVFLVMDEHGLPVRDGIFLDVEGPGELVAACDVNPHRPGTQVATSKGRAVVTLPPMRGERREKVHVSLDALESGCRVAWEAPLREWFLLGYGEASAGWSGLDGRMPVNTAERLHDGLFAEGKIALFGQGEVRSGHLATVALDTRPYREDRLFDTIEPDRYYPLYGDASELEYNAASRSGTYARLDHARYTAMFGDFRTGLGRTEFTRYHRAFNGLSGEGRFDRGRVAGFVTRTDQSVHQEEIPADGTSGFYFLRRYPLVENSEKIRLEVRDRYRPERVLRVDDKQRHRDYDINYLDGTILFKEPLRSTDEDLNPVTIVVSYECRDAEANNFIYGMRAEVSPADSLLLGVTAVLEEEGEENASLVGFDVAGPLRPGVRLESEYAHSETFLLGGADAFRARLRGNHAEAISWEAYFRDIDGNFFNPSFSGGKTELGSRKVGGRFGLRFDRRLSIAASGYEHRFRERDERRGYWDLVGRWREGGLRADLGLAGASHGETGEGTHDALLFRAGAGLERGRMKGELQLDQIVAGDEVEEYPNRLQAKLSWKLWRGLAADLRHEYRTGGRSGTRHLTQFGLESRITDDLNAFSRYRLEGAAGGERGQATVGLENRFRLSPALTGTVSAERLATVSGKDDEDFLAVATGWVWTPSDEAVKLKGDYEIRLEESRRKHLLNLAALRRLGGGWAALATGDLWYDDENDGADRIKGKSTLGLSMRAGTRPLVFLGLVRTNWEKNSPAHPDAVDRVLETSIEANWRPVPCWEIEGKTAARWVENTFRSWTASSSSFLWQAHVVRTFGRRWDIGATLRVVHQVETGTLRWGGGLEAGRVLAGNVWLGAGYDLGGHRNDDSPDNDFTRHGFHVTLKMKFDEKIMRLFHGM